MSMTPITVTISSVWKSHCELNLPSNSVHQCLVLCQTVLPLGSREMTPIFLARLPMSQKTSQKDMEKTGVMIAKDP